MKHDDQTIEVRNWSFQPTKDGGNLIIHDAYGTYSVKLTGDQLKDHVSQHETKNVLETARENRALRELGNSVRYNPDRRKEQGLER